MNSEEIYPSIVIAGGGATGSRLALELVWLKTPTLEQEELK